MTAKAVVVLGVPHFDGWVTRGIYPILATSPPSVHLKSYSLKAEKLLSRLSNLTYLTTLKTEIAAANTSHFHSFSGRVGNICRRPPGS